MKPHETEAELKGWVTPQGSETTYRFEYGPTSNFGSSIPVPDAVIGAGATGTGVLHQLSPIVTDVVTTGGEFGVGQHVVGEGIPRGARIRAINGDSIELSDAYPGGGDPMVTLTVRVPVAEQVRGLAPGSDYHVRLVAENARGVSEGPADTFRTRTAPAAPSPCPNDPVRVQQRSTYLPECRAYELVTNVDTNGTNVQTALRTSGDGRRIAWSSLGSYADTTGGSGVTVYVGRRGGSGWEVNALAPTFTERSEPGALSQVKASSLPDDLETLVTVSRQSFDADDQDFSPLGMGADDIYRVLKGGATIWLSRGEGVTANDPFSGAKLAGESGDGSTVFFTSSEPLTSDVPGGGTEFLYRWRDGVLTAVGRDESGNILTEGSALGGRATDALDFGDLPDSGAVSSDGNRFVYRGSPANLFAPMFIHDDATGNEMITRSQRTGSVGDPAPTGGVMIAATPDLNRIFFQSPDQLTDDAPVEGGAYLYDAGTDDLRFSHPTGSLSTGSPSGLVKVSDDGSYVYFTVDKALDPAAVPGERNLYLKHAGVTTFIGTIAPEDVINSVPFSGQSHVDAGISADGSRLAFQTSASLDGHPTEGFDQVYVYDALTHELECASCPPGGGVPDADAGLGRGWRELLTSPARSFTADGQTVAFTTAMSLVPRDTNQRDDVYVNSGGTISLVSGGNTQYPATLAGMSPDGTDLYIRTADPLVPQDTDGALSDLYDVRIGGGFLAPTPAKDCQGELCGPPPVPAPPRQVAGSASYVGPGTAAAKRKHRAKKRHKAKQHRKKKNGTKKAKRTAASRGEK